MSYDVALETYTPSRAWFMAKARDGLAGFACEAASTLRNRDAKGEAFDALLTGAMADEAFELRAMARGGPVGDPESFRGYYLFVDEGRAAVVVEPGELMRNTQALDGLTAVNEEGWRHELIIVDGATPDHRQLVEDLLRQRTDASQIELVVLDSSRGGVEQISEILSNYADLDAVHLVSHGTDGALNLGSGWLTSGNMDAYSNQISQWGEALSDDADLARESEQLAHRLIERSTTSLAYTKQLLRLGLSRTLDEQLELEKQYQQAASSTAEFRDGIDAFLARSRSHD